MAGHKLCEPLLKLAESFSIKVPSAAKPRLRRRNPQFIGSMEAGPQVPASTIDLRKPRRYLLHLDDAPLLIRSADISPLVNVRSVRRRNAFDIEHFAAMSVDDLVV